MCVAEPLAHLEIRIVGGVVDFDLTVIRQLSPLTLHEGTVSLKCAFGAGGMSEPRFNMASSRCLEEEQDSGRLENVD